MIKMDASAPITVIISTLELVANHTEILFLIYTLSVLRGASVKHTLANDSR